MKLTDEKQMVGAQCAGNAGLPQEIRQMTPEEIGRQARVEAEIREVKQLRVALDGVLQRMKDGERPFRGDARPEAIKKVQEGIMWLGMELKELGNENPYPNSYNPTNTLVDKTADGLKL